MPINIGDNFSYLGKKFLDNRESFDTIAEMAQCNEVPNGFITYCKEDKQRYTYQDTNTIDSKLGKWRLFEVGISDDDFANLIENFALKEELHEHDNKDLLDKINQTKINEWDNKSEFSGDYDDLSNKPNIPSTDGLASEEYVDDVIDALELIETSAIKPTNSQISIWINTSEDTSVSALARINDSTIARDTTWSSEKLNDLFIEMRNTINELKVEISELHEQIDNINN